MGFEIGATSDGIVALAPTPGGAWVRFLSGSFLRPTGIEQDLRFLERWL
jgi:hypothetical protein